MTFDNKENSDHPHRRIDVHVDEIISIEVNVGEKFEICCGGVPVRPPYLMIESFIELPEFLEFLKVEIPESEGTHEDLFTIQVKEIGSGLVSVGYKQLQDGQPTHVKSILVKSID